MVKLLRKHFTSMAFSAETSLSSIKMIITRDDIWEDAPRSKADGVFRRLVVSISSLGWTCKIIFYSILSFSSVLSKSSSRRDLMRHLYATGIRTLPVVTVTSFFTGMILSLQVGLELARFNQEIYLGAAVMISLIREMGPFSCGMCLAACVGSAIAAELGTMKVNDEIAALEIMSISPIKYLVSPRIMALLLMSPLLAFYCCVTGTVGGGLVGQTQLGVDFGQYMASAMSVAETKDIFVGLLKAAVFSIVIGGVSVAQGFATSRGATGVGKSTQRSVIISFLLILILGYMITRLCYQ
jgi:phospholipid/cholesterol/gamma-HCH transport system permease protein